MASHNPNPFQAPNTSSYRTETETDVSLPPKDLNKVNAIIKDAGQFWLACILCVLCSAIGAIIIPVWYSVRLVQWSSLGKRYPGLKTPNPAPGSLVAKYQSSQWKLIVGIIFGCLIFAIVVGMFASAYFAIGEAQRIQR